MLMGMVVAVFLVHWAVVMTVVLVRVMAVWAVRSVGDVWLMVVWVVTRASARAAWSSINDELQRRIFTGSQAPA